MIILELNVMGDTYRPYQVAKDSQRSVEKTVHFKFLFAFEEVALLHPDGVKGIYSIKFLPEGDDEFTVTPEPTVLYSPEDATQRIIRIICSFNTNLYLRNCLFSDPPAANKIGFKVD
jgi:hypothetical protein